MCGSALSLCIASTPEPEGGARCVSSARRDLRGGRGAILVLPRPSAGSKLRAAATPAVRCVSKIQNNSGLPQGLSAHSAAQCIVGRHRPQQSLWLEPNGRENMIADHGYSPGSRRAHNFLATDYRRRAEELWRSVDDLRKLLREQPERFELRRRYGPFPVRKVNREDLPGCGLIAAAAALETASCRRSECPTCAGEPAYARIREARPSPSGSARRESVAGLECPGMARVNAR
jgi:hypothetical protein